MTFELNFEGDEGGGFELIPVGEYPAYINNIMEKGEGEGKYLNFRFVIADGPQAKRNAFTNCSLKKEAIWKLKNILIAAGIVKKGHKGAVQWNLPDLIGRKVGIRVAHEEYEGTKRETVAAIFSLEARTAPTDTAPAGGAAAPATGGVKRL